ncbi:MAG: NUDIX hydrolase [Actinobacteria bacterium]|mgnify:FL=1|nr:NUDIX hydrolase [Actinomycetota bacterium]
MKIPLPPVPLPDAVAELAQKYVDGTRTPVEPRQAATVILLAETHDADQSSGGPEVYYLRRQVSMDFAAGMAVFPGGGVDKRDFDAEVAWAGPTPAEWAVRLSCDEDLARALVCAAVRETFEESGVLLAGPAADSDTTVVADTTGDDWEADRVALESRELSLTDFLNRRELELRSDLLGVWDAWLTPIFEPKRYETWFFVAKLPEGQRTRDVSTESSSVAWLRAGTAAAQAESGELAMMPPTYLTSLEIAGFETRDEVLAAAADRTAVMFTPTVEPLGEGFTLSMPDRLRPVLAERRR